MSESQWVMRVVFDADERARTVAQLDEIGDSLTDAGFDASVAVQPLLNHWTVVIGDAVPATAVGVELWDRVQPYLTKLEVHDPVIAVETFTLDEWERRAAEPTLPVLAGASEVAALLGVTRQRVHQLRSLPDFPSPLVEVAMGPLWDERAVEAFARQWTRKPGRRAGSLGG